MPKTIAVILAAGSGARFLSDVPKQFTKIAGKSLLEHTIEVFEKSECIDETIIVINPNFRMPIESILQKNNYRKVRKLLNGGATRKESSYIAIQTAADDDLLIIHDAVRPFLSEQIIEDCVHALAKYQAVDVAIPSADTIIEVADDIIVDIPPRARMMRGQTPQAFIAGAIRKAHVISMEKNDEDFTDDCGLIRKYNVCDIFVVRGEEANIKITFPEDIYLEDALFRLKSTEITNREYHDCLKGKVIAVFGASQGIGEAVCRLAVEQGAKVCGFSRSINNVDIADPAAVDRAFKNIIAEHGKLDAVVVTAAVLNIGKLESREYEDIHQEIMVNYLGVVNIIRQATPYLKETKGAIALFTSSSYSRGRALYSTYSSIKAALVNLTQALAEELEQDRIRINIINPERTATPMRTRNFGYEPPESLLEADTVATVTLKSLCAEFSGQVLYVRKK